VPFLAAAGAIITFLAEGSWFLVAALTMFALLGWGTYLTSLASLAFGGVIIWKTWGTWWLLGGMACWFRRHLVGLGCPWDEGPRGPRLRRGPYSAEQPVGSCRERTGKAAVRRFLRCVEAAGLLSLLAAAVFGMSWAIFDGPGGVRGWALILMFVLAGLVVMGLWAVLLLKAGAHPGGVVFAGLVALFFTGTVPAGFSEWLLHERGRFSTCRVLTITEEEGFNGASTVYVHRLACDGLGPTSITRSDRTLRVNQHVRVHYDPEGRSDKARLAGAKGAMERHHIILLAGVELGLMILASLVLVATGRPDP
jgi:hypothetical protein